MVTIGSSGATKPEGININETLYIIRHADAHPLETGPMVTISARGSGAHSIFQCAARKNQPAAGLFQRSRPRFPRDAELLVWGCAFIDRRTIRHREQPALWSGRELSTTSTMSTSNFFFTGDQFSNQAVLVAWSYQFIQPTVNDLIASYFSPDASANGADLAGHRLRRRLDGDARRRRQPVGGQHAVRGHRFREASGHLPQF